MKIRHWIILSFTLVMTVLGIVALITIQHFTREVMVDTIGNYNALLARGYSATIDRMIYSRLERWEAYTRSNQDLLTALMTSNKEYEQLSKREEVIAKRDKEWIAAAKNEITPFMESVISNQVSEGLKIRVKYYKDVYGYNIFPEFFVTNKYGVNVAQNIKTSDYLQADEGWWQNTVKNRLWVGDVIYDESSGTQGLELGIRIDDPEGNLMGVAKIVYNIKDIFNIVDEIVGERTSGQDMMINIPRETVNAYLINEDNKLIYSIKGGWGNFQDESTMARMFDADKKSMVTYKVQVKDGTEKLFSHAHSEGYKGYSGQNWVMVISKDTKEALSPVYLLSQEVLLGILLAMLVAIVLSIIISKTLTDPINRLRRGVEIIEKGDLNYRVGIKGGGEIGQLSQSFDKMVETVKESRASIDRKVEEQTKTITEQKDKINAILQSIGDGVFVVDTNMRVLLINQVAADMAGYAIDEVMGKPYEEYLKFVFDDEKDRVNREFVDKTMKQGTITKMANHTVLISKNGTRTAVADSAAPLKDKEGKIVGCVVVFRDVSKEREIDKMKSDFISVASHQLRTPLGSMRWNLEMLLGGDMGELPSEAKNTVTQIYESDQHLINVVNDLLDVSRIEQGKTADEAVMTNIMSVVSEVVKETEGLANQKQVTIQIETTLEHSESTMIDSKRLREVMSNLVSNAIKYNKPGGKVTVTIVKNDAGFEIKVADDGLGIPIADQPKIFDKFFRAVNAVRSETEGSGLGLFVVRSYTEAWGGKASFVSEEGKGSEFTVTIPYGR